MRSARISVSDEVYILASVLFAVVFTRDQLLTDLPNNMTLFMSDLPGDDNRGPIGGLIVCVGGVDGFLHSQRTDAASTFSERLHGTEHVLYGCGKQVGECGDVATKYFSWKS